MNNMEIKKGDKVRVSKDASKIYTKDGFNLATKMDFEVVEIEDECARIENADGILTMAYVLPTKYLVKVDAEAKERKIKCGDKVLAMETDQIAPSSEAETFRRNVSLVTKIKNGIASLFIIDRYGANHYARTAVEFLQKVTDEPKEQTEAKYIKTKGDTLTFPITFDLSDSYWDAYTADLAKEIALKVANKYSDPTEAAEYAVQVAKAVVENLKNKQL